MKREFEQERARNQRLKDEAGEHEDVERRLRQEVDHLVKQSEEQQRQISALTAQSARETTESRDTISRCKRKLLVCRASVVSVCFASVLPKAHTGSDRHRLQAENKAIVEDVKREFEQERARNQHLISTSFAAASHLLPQTVCAADEARELQGMVEEWRACELRWRAQLGEAKWEADCGRTEGRELQRELALANQRMQQYWPGHAFP
jgi:hypothetical protein